MLNKIKLIIAVSILTLSLSAQTDIKLKISHFLGGNPFAFNAAASNNLGNSFNVTRLDYYISQIKIIHDGGQITAIPNTWILVKANTSTEELLGNLNITNVEAIQFGIGIEQTFNHTDPSTYPLDHPLSFQSPSMHWGWSAGYRFAAIEGNSSPTLNQLYQFHSLGDVNYHVITIPTSGILSGNEITIELKADYEKALKNIDLSFGGNIIHGESGKAAAVLYNFGKYVFRSSEGNMSIDVKENNLEESQFKFYPNPSHQNVKFTGDLNGKTLIITNSLGASMDYELNSSNTIAFKNPGVYFINIFENGKLIQSEKILILK